MKLIQLRQSSTGTLTAGNWLRLTLIILPASVFVSLPHTFNARVTAEPRSSIGFLFTVNTTDDHNDFSCDGTDCTLREAIEAANNALTADTIDFSVTGTITLRSALPDIIDAVTINGPGANVLTVRRDSTDLFRIFNVTATSTVSFSRLTVSDGFSRDDGGGICNAGTGTVNVTNSTISENRASADGGGIENRSAGTVNVSNSTISGNDGGRGSSGGGGIDNHSTGRVNITDSTISDNFTFRTSGGGISNLTTGTVAVTNSTISGNRAEAGDGGGISNLGAGEVSFTNSTISTNEGSVGGGISNSGTGNVSVTTSTINENEAFGGAGIDNRRSGTVSVTTSLIDDNTASHEGGGIHNADTGTVTVIDSTVSSNRAVDGGGISNDETGTVNVTNSTISGNDGGRGASGGGGIANRGTGLVNLTNSTISGNFTSRAVAGGISNFSTGTVNVTNCTVSGNLAVQGDGGGIFNSGGTVNVKSSIIAVNSADQGPDVKGTFGSQGFNLIGKTNGSTGFPAPTDLAGTIAAPLDPRLETDGLGKLLLKDNGGPTMTIALLCGSPAIERGTSHGLTGNLATDQRGTAFPRIVDDPLVPNTNDSQGDGTDIGAFELQQICNHPPVAQCRNIQTSAGGNCQASITAAQVDNGSFDPDLGDSITSRMLDNSGPFGLGPHSVMLTLTDTHGASSSCAATVTIVDTTPPMVMCPANAIARTANPGVATVVVNYSQPLASDNCSTPTVVCSPPSGSQFSPGTTTVNCLATDGATNTSSCSFTVTVFDVCVQDDTARSTLLFNSRTGDYLFVKCGAGGLSLGGRGISRVMGSAITLEHSPLDRRVTARIDNSQKKGIASVQTFSPSATCTITDRNTADNTCACP